MLALFTLLTALSGGGLLFLAFWMRRRSRACRSWPAADGVVLESRVDDHNLETMKPVLRYRYVVHGQEYIGTRVAYAGYGVSKAAMAQLLAPYPVGASVPVFYDPQRPERAVLDNRGRSDWWYWGTVGVAFLALGWWLRGRGLG